MHLVCAAPCNGILTLFFKGGDRRLKIPPLLPGACPDEIQIRPPASKIHGMVVQQTDRIASMIASHASELDALGAYPEEELVEVIRDVGFSCTCCGRCCTRAFNDHVFLLESDAETVLEVDPAALMPAPYFEFCDQEGRFYVPGYALRTQEDGRCVFLSAEDRCTIYDRRMSICRVYPYMLHREADEEG